MFNNLTTNWADIMHHPGKIFPSVLAMALIATAVVIVLHLILALLGGRAPKARKRFNIWEKLVYLGALVSVGVLGVTSFYTVLRFGGMHRWWLFVHMFGAGAMTGILPLLALTWCGASRFGRPTQRQVEEGYLPRFFWIPRVMFWLFLLAGLVVMLTMLVSMLPVFGSDGLEVLLDIHRYAGLLAVVALLIHFYCVLLQRAQLR
jgi:hypothetical protein